MTVLMQQVLTALRCALIVVENIVVSCFAMFKWLIFHIANKKGKEKSMCCKG